MSAPPISSPFTNTCGIVGQPGQRRELLPDLRVGEDVDGGDGSAGGAERLERAHRVAAHRELRRPLHEQDDVLVVDDFLDALAQVAHSVPFVVILNSWMVPSASGSARAE